MSFIGAAIAIAALPFIPSTRGVAGPISAAAIQTEGKGKGWRGLVPLLSRRREVEGLLGSPQTAGGSSYDTDDATVFVHYSDGPCEKGWPYGWNVAKDTVERITVAPKKRLMLADLQLNEKKYLKSTDSHISSRIYYENSDEGIVIDVDDITGTVRSFTFIPTSSEAKFRCPDAANRLPVGRSQADPIEKFDEYGAVSPKVEQERLDIVAAALARLPQSEVYIFAYAGRIAQTGEAQARASCARDYLVKKHHIDDGRIRAIDGGYRDEFLVEIYIEEKDGPIPLARPSVRPSKIQIVPLPRAAKCFSSSLKN